MAQLFADRQAQRSALHTRHLNEQFVRVLKTIGFDVGFQKGQGQYLFDRDGARYLDLLSAASACSPSGAIIRCCAMRSKACSTPTCRTSSQFDVSTLAGVLAERLLELRAVSRQGVLRQFRHRGASRPRSSSRAAPPAVPASSIARTRFHGLTYGALSLTGDSNFRTGFEPLLPGCTSIPFNDLAALEQALSSREVAAFVVEPIQGKGVNMPTDDFLPGARRSAANTARCSWPTRSRPAWAAPARFLAVEHWNVEPDMVLLSKSLSGGHVPVGALLTRKSIFDKIFDRMDRAVVHGSTFSKNDLAMAAGIATLDVMKSEKLIENAAKRGAELRLALTRMVPGYELLKEVRGKGLMIGIEFGPPKSLRLKASWNVLETANKGLFCQLITMPLFKDHKILTQVAGHGSHTIKLLPPLTITDEDCSWIEKRVRRRHRRQPPGSRRGLVARQDAGRQRGAAGRRKLPPAAWCRDMRPAEAGRLRNPQIEHLLSGH